MHLAGTQDTVDGVLGAGSPRAVQVVSVGVLGGGMLSCGFSWNESLIS